MTYEYKLTSSASLTKSPNPSLSRARRTWSAEIVFFCCWLHTYEHRRRINTYSKRRKKSSLLFWGTHSIHFFAPLAILNQDGWLKEKDPGAKQLSDKELNQFCFPNSSDDLCLLFYLYPSSMITQEKCPQKGRTNLLLCHWLPASRDRFLEGNRLSVAMT